VKPSVRYIISKDNVYRAILDCLMELEVASLKDLIACIAGEYPDALRAPETIRRRLSTLESLGVVEKHVATTSVRKDVWSVKKSVAKDLRRALDQNRSDSLRK